MVSTLGRLKEPTPRLVVRSPLKVAILIIVVSGELRAVSLPDR
jgi:hypothetical protein